MSSKLSQDAFKWDDHWWVTTVPAAGWPGESGAGQLGGVSPRPVRVVFAPEGRGPEDLADSELQLVGWCLAHLERLRDAALSALLDRYPALQQAYDLEPQEAEAWMPQVADVEELAALLTTTGIHIHQILHGDVPYLGLEFECRWDPEHGVGILLHGDEVVRIGGANTAFVLWMAEEHAESQGWVSPEGW